MKKVGYTAVPLILVLLGIIVYQNLIYYKVSYNPIKEHASETPLSFHITENLPTGESVTEKCQTPRTCKSVLKYLSELKLVPLKNKTAQKLLSYEDSSYYTGMLQLNDSDKIFISDVSENTPNVLNISSSKPGFKAGYYKIEDSNFDYNYVIKLIRDDK